MLEHDNKAIFSNNLNNYLLSLNKTQTEVARSLGIKISTFSSWCTAKKMPRMDKIELLARYFGIQKSDLIEEHSSGNNIINKIKGNSNAIQTGSGIAIVTTKKTLEDTLEPQIQELIRIYKLIVPKKQMELLQFAYELEESNLK